MTPTDQNQITGNIITKSNIISNSVFFWGNHTQHILVGANEKRETQQRADNKGTKEVDNHSYGPICSELYDIKTSLSHQVSESYR